MKKLILITMTIVSVFLTSHVYANTQDVRVKEIPALATGTNSIGVVSTNPVGWSFTNIAGAATTTVKSGAAVLHSIIINKAVATGVVTVYDNTAASGTKLATITQPAAILQSQNEMIYDAIVSTGITVVTSAADDITVTYR